MTNKESLREKFVNTIHKEHIIFEYPSDFEKTLNFFWNEIEQIRKSDMERVVEKIKDMKVKYINENDYYINGKDGDFKNRVIDQVLSIIKQDEN